MVWLLSPMGDLTISGAFLSATVGGGYRQRVVAREAAEHPTTHRTASHNKSSSSPRCQQRWGWETLSWVHRGPDSCYVPGRQSGHYVASACCPSWRRSFQGEWSLPPLCPVGSCIFICHGTHDSLSYFLWHISGNVHNLSGPQSSHLRNGSANAADLRR